MACDVMFDNILLYFLYFTLLYSAILYCVLLFPSIEQNSVNMEKTKSCI